MANPHFIGLIYSVRSSAEAALGEVTSPMVTRLAKDGILARKTGERSLHLLEMLMEKTNGNLDETELVALRDAIQAIKTRLEQSPQSQLEAQAARNPEQVN